MRGGSQSHLIQADDGRFYVVKFQNNLQGPNVLFNESAGSELFTACGLNTPAWAPLLVTEDFLQSHRECWIQDQHGPLKPQAGLCYASSYLGLDGVRTLEILPKCSHGRIQDRHQFWLAWLVDICAEHADNRQALFIEDSDGNLRTSFIDHGSLFGGPLGSRSSHFLVSRYLDWRIYPECPSSQQKLILDLLLNLDTDNLIRRILTLPEEWKVELAVSKVERTLHRLALHSLMQNILEAVMASVALKISESEARFQDGVHFPDGSNRSRMFLHPGIRATVRD